MSSMIIHDLATTGTKSCCSICRELIKAGENPETHIEFIRGTTPVFASRPLKFWAALTVKESTTDGKPMRFVRYQGGE